MRHFPVEEYLEYRYNELLSVPPQKIVLTRDWVTTFTKEAGVYIFRDKKTIIYAGETGNFRGRMKDMLDTRNHTSRRNIGNTKFMTVEGWAKATSKIKFIETIEEMLDEHLRKNITVAVMPVNLGRKELEELIFERHDPEYNRKGKRKTF